MDSPANRHEHAAILTDLVMYGTHAPHLRYRQERLRALLETASESQTGLDAQSAPHLRVRERIGSRLIAWGKRLEGCPNPTVAHPA
jgi:hypothetical protein